MLPVTKPSQVIGLTASSSSGAILSLVKKSLRSPSRSPSQWPGPRWSPNQAAVTLPPETDEINFTSSVNVCGPSMPAYLVCDSSCSTDSASAAAREPPPENVIRITGRSALAGSILRRSGLASPACNGVFSTWVLAQPPASSKQSNSRTRSCIALALCFAEWDGQRMAGCRAADYPIPVGRRITRTGQRDHVIIGLYRQFALGRANGIAAGDDLSDIARIESDANIFHSGDPCSCASLTNNFCNRNGSCRKPPVE